ncbi:MAG TPA: hypothetical protein VGG16_13620 [Streptosporangiaceae bacterium]
MCRVLDQSGAERGLDLRAFAEIDVQQRVQRVFLLRHRHGNTDRAEFADEPLDGGDHRPRLVSGGRKIVWYP